MKFRKLLITLRLWARACRARREVNRLKRTIEALTTDFESEKRLLTRHYEKQLAVERTRNETLHLAWADRWLQREKLATLSVSTSLIDEKAEAKLLQNDAKDPDPAEDLTLNSSQMFELQERREQFFQDGRAANRSMSEIHNRWNDIKSEVIKDIRASIT